jgi:excisionase family DNA binding protein
MSTHKERNRRGDNGDVPEALLTLREACRLLNVHSNTLRRWSAMGLIPAYRLGPSHHRRFKAEDISALIVEQTKFGLTDTSR